MDKKNDTLMIIVLGKLGRLSLEILVRIPNICKIVVADLDEDYGLRRTNTALIGVS